MVLLPPAPKPDSLACCLPTCRPVVDAALKMWNMLLGDFDTEMYMNGEQFDWIKIIWFLIFFALGFYILLNMLLAIVMDAYTKVGETIDTDAPDVCTDYTTLCHYYRRSFCAMFCCCCKNKKSKLNYADMADVIERKSLDRIAAAYSKASPEELVAQFSAFATQHLPFVAIAMSHTEPSGDAGREFNNLESAHRSRKVCEDEANILTCAKTRDRGGAAAE